MIIQSIPHLESIISICLKKIEEADTHIKFWEKHNEPDMKEYAKKIFNYDITLELYAQAKTELQKIINN